MPKLPLVDRLRALKKRIFFWLPGDRSQNEQLPDTLHDHALVMAVVSPERVPRWKQLRYALRVFSFRERRLILISGGVGLIALAISGFWFFHQGTTVVPTVGGTFVEALSGQPKYLNPIDAVANDVDRDIVRLLYSGLFRFDGVEVKPDLAESYIWSDDGKVLTIKMRTDARFHDGENVTAEDVRFTYASVQDPARKSPMLPLYRGMRVEATDGSTVTFTLDRPDVNLLDKLTLGIVPAHLWSDVPVSNTRLSDLNVKPIGSGPYRVKSFSRVSNGQITSYTLERFEQYAGIKPYLSTVTFQFYPDKVSALDAFKTDKVDAVAFVSTAEAGKLTSSARKQHVRLELPEETVAFFNVKHPLLASKDVRKALLLAIDRSELVETLHGDAEAIYGPFPFSVATSSGSDIEAARTLLTNAGWTLADGSSVRVKLPPKPQATFITKIVKGKKVSVPAPEPPPSVTPPQELAITIAVPTEPDLIAMAETLKRRWSLLGVKVTVEAAPLDEIVHKAVRDRDVAMVTMLNVFLGPDQDIFPFWWSGQAVERGLNFSGLSDRSLDTSLEHLRGATSTEALESARNEATGIIADSAAAAFLVRPLYNYLISADINGVPEHMQLAVPAERFQTIDQWYRKTAWRWK